LFQKSDFQPTYGTTAPPVPKVGASNKMSFYAIMPSNTKRVVSKSSVEKLAMIVYCKLLRDNLTVRLYASAIIRTIDDSAAKSMTIAQDAVIIGLTGSFGSGCSTLANALAKNGFIVVSLSKLVRDTWEEKAGGKEPSRGDLQDTGNSIRLEKGNDFLAKSALATIESSAEPESKLVFDSIRHPAEITELRNKSRNFFLVAVSATKEERWRRLRKSYEEKKLTSIVFDDDEERDQFEDMSYGQKVQLCVDNADVVLINEKPHRTKIKQEEELFEKLRPYIDLITGETVRSPTPKESFMAIAYAKALNSRCYKRQVGAVIVDDNGNILGMGCNENPTPLGSCDEEWGECYRDIYKKDILESLKDVNCPKCGKPISQRLPNGKCECGVNLDKYFIRDRAISRCTALHAEETAIMNAGNNNLKGCTIYTTTFPCFKCAQRILNCGIKKVIYCEPYPDPDVAELFAHANEKSPSQPVIEAQNFEGVKAHAYFRVFSSWRPKWEDKINEKLRE
jgi:deoxycytidylate deaminase